MHALYRLTLWSAYADPATLDGMKSEITLAQQTDTALCAGWQFPSTRRGARRARQTAARQLICWGWTPSDELFQDAELIVAELASNAIMHGHVRGDDFELGMRLGPCPGLATLLRIEVSDWRGEQVPSLPEGPALDAESGRGLLLVDALADRWGAVARPPSRKTLWCELDLTGSQQK
ncbi:anti-sigma regulatory factor (Ser/Thr protein kinase) [Kitasatospora sp. GAS204A]|uniref:ATP-binding protein n=1 Tax=unclassified Kitasatospora TaxID=2633591 RepID=UPI0024747E2C|nr:ATP-binding protein [Kitasatospora sp. GAS204B]MDH6117288.1 anti-sigma regulatory factor (Ser/Thr protein kinase) [Kitasatospora sp. GAS204B]